MTKPNKVKIGPQTFDIAFRESKSDGMLNDGNYGYTLDMGNLIVIASDISLDKQKVTVLHEILHAARMIYQGYPTPRNKAPYEDWEHHFIGIFENALITMMQENKDLVAWLSD